MLLPYNQNYQQNLHGFYRKNEVEFLGKRINFAFATNLQLEQYAANGLVLFNELYPPKQPSFLKKAMGVTHKITKVGAVAIVGVMAVGAVSVAVSGMAVAAAPAVGTVGEIVGTTATTSGAVSSGVMATIQNGATYAGGAGLAYTAATGKAPSDKLLSTAKALESGNLTDAAMDIAKKEFKDQNLKVDENDPAAEEALRNRLEREQETYAGQLRILANEQKVYDGLPQEKVDPGWLKYAAIATPFALFFLSN